MNPTLLTTATHAKTPKHVDEDELDRKTTIERSEVGLDELDGDN